MPAQDVPGTCSFPGGEYARAALEHPGRRTLRSQLGSYIYTLLGRGGPID